MAKKRKRRHKTRILDGKCHVDWSSLPQGIIEMIVDKLPLIDHLSLSKVCKSWNDALCEGFPGRLIHGIPWLLVSGEQFKESRTCISVLDKRIWDLELPEAYGKYCWGSFQEWLIMVNDVNSYILEIKLLNPFTRSQVTLPPIWNFYHKIVLSGHPSENDFVCMLLHSQRMELALYTPREQSWLKHKMTGTAFEDAVFCNGSFYLLDQKYNIWKIDAKDICFSISKGDAHFGTLFELEIGFHEIKMPYLPQLNEVPVLEGRDENYVLKYLVESCGEVLLVCRYLHTKQNLVLVTQKFEVYSLNLCQSSWERVKDLKDRMLFLGKCCSSSFSTKELGVGIANSIYFTNDQATPWWNEWDSDHINNINVSTRLGVVKNVDGNWCNFKLRSDDDDDVDDEPFSFRGDVEKWPYTWFTAPMWWYCKNVPPIPRI